MNNCIAGSVEVKCSNPKKNYVGGRNQQKCSRATDAITINTSSNLHISVDSEDISSNRSSENGNPPSLRWLLVLLFLNVLARTNGTRRSF